MWLFECVSWLTLMCAVPRSKWDMTHVHVYLDSFACAPWLIHTLHSIQDRKEFAAKSDLSLIWIQISQIRKSTSDTRPSDYHKSSQTCGDINTYVTQTRTWHKHVRDTNTYMTQTRTWNKHVRDTNTYVTQNVRDTNTYVTQTRTWHKHIRDTQMIQFQFFTCNLQNSGKTKLQGVDWDRVGNMYDTVQDITSMHTYLSICKYLSINIFMYT